MKKYTALEKFGILDAILQGDLTVVGAALELGVPARTIRCWKK